MRTLIVLVALAMAHPALADELATARELEAKLEYDQALALVEATLARGRADPDRYVELHLLAGRLAAGLDKPQMARDHFARVLAIRPSTTLPEGTSPKLTLPFNVEKTHATPLVVTIAARRGALAFEATDPLGLVAAVHIRYRIAGASDSMRVPIAKQIALPAAAWVIDVTALDAVGNRLWVGAPPAIVDEPRSKPRVYAWWPTYATIGGVALAFGGIAAWRFSASQDTFDRLDAEGGHDFSELQAVERRGKRWALATNVSFGVAALSGVIALVVGIRSRGDRAVIVTPTTNGAALSGRF